MKKICVFLVSIEIILSGILLLNILKNIAINDFLYEDTFKISLLLKQNEGNIRKPESQVKFIEDVASKYDVAFYKYIFKNNQDITVYATDFSKGNRVNLLEGRLPKKNSDEKITNFPDKSKNIVGQFLWTNDDRDLSIRPFSKIVETGVDGIYYIGTTDQKKINAIISELQQSLGDIEQYDTIGANKLILKILVENPILLISTIVVMVVNLFSFFYYIIHNSKKIAIYQIYGLTIFSKLVVLLKPMLSSIVIISLSFYFGYLSYVTFFHGGLYGNLFF